MLQNSIYSVISPEGCASILWRDNDKAELAAESLGITAKFLKSKGPSLLEIKIKNGSIENLKRPKNLKSIKDLFIKN